LLGILGTALLGIPLGIVKYQGILSAPPSVMPTLFKLNILGAVQTGLITVVFIFFFLDLSDTMGTLIGVSAPAGFLKDGKLPRSYLHKLGLFLDFWISLEMNQYSKLVVDASGGKNPRIEAYCLDPSVGTEIIRDFHSSIHMSGTLEPLEEYRDSIGLTKNTELVGYPSPFPKQNRKILFVGDVTTKYDEINKDEKIIKRMQNYVTSVCNTFPKNTIVFFPSFNIMSMFKNQIDLDNINRGVYFEEQEMSQTALMELVSDFKQHGNQNEGGATLFSVIGGRISEGMDFPAEQLEIAVIVGIPYPKPTARQRGLQRYYDIKFGKGWEYTVEAPTARKLLQSIGRLIRDENDRGVAVILDRRAPRFKKYIRDTNMDKITYWELQKSLAKELGDVLWYVAVLADELDLILKYIAEENIKKLASRQERGKISGSGDNR